MSYRTDDHAPLYSSYHYCFFLTFTLFHFLPRLSFRISPASSFATPSNSTHDSSPASPFLKIERPGDRSSENTLSSTKSTDNSALYNQFLSWMRTNGAEFPNLGIREYAQDYRGIHVCSSHTIPKHSTLLRVPHRLLITTQLAKQSDLGRIVSEYSNLGSQSIIAVYLLNERLRGSDSSWSPWIQIMPTTFSTLPMFFDQRESKMLVGCRDLNNKVSRET